MLTYITFCDLRNFSYVSTANVFIAHDNAMLLIGVYKIMFPKTGSQIVIAVISMYQNMCEKRIFSSDDEILSA